MCREPELLTTKHPLLRCGSVCRLIFEPCLQCFLGDTASSADVPSACRVDKETLEVLLNKPMTTARRSEEHTSELQSLMRISYAVFCLKKKTNNTTALNKLPNMKK